MPMWHWIGWGSLVLLFVLALPPVRRWFQIKHRGKRLLCAVMAVLLGVLIWIFPMHRWMAYRAVERYEAARTNPWTIIHKEARWNVKQGGYDVGVEYGEDPGRLYYYHFPLWGGWNTPIERAGNR